MKTIKKTEIYYASRAQLFRCIDNLAITGTHITISPMMIGSKLNLAFLTESHRGLGSRYRWTGKMLGMYMDFVEEVTKWNPEVEKTWETIGKPRLILYSWYKVQFEIMAIPGGFSRVELSMSYERPAKLFYKVLSYFFADWCCRGFLKKMLKEAKKSIELNKIKSISKYKSYEIY